MENLEDVSSILNTPEQNKKITILAVQSIGSAPLETGRQANRLAYSIMMELQKENGLSLVNIANFVPDPDYCLTLAQAGHGIPNNIRKEEGKEPIVLTSERAAHIVKKLTSASLGEISSVMTSKKYELNDPDQFKFYSKNSDGYLINQTSKAIENMQRFLDNNPGEIDEIMQFYKKKVDYFKKSIY